MTDADKIVRHLVEADEFEDWKESTRIHGKFRLVNIYALSNGKQLSDAQYSSGQVKFDDSAEWCQVQRIVVERGLVFSAHQLSDFEDGILKQEPGDMTWFRPLFNIDLPGRPWFGFYATVEHI